MRAALLASIFTSVSFGAMASPPVAGLPNAPVVLRLPGDVHFGRHFARPARDSDDPALPDAPVSESWTGFRLWPLHAEAASDPRPGKSRRIVQYRVDGLSLFGGAVGGQLGGRGAMLTLSWGGDR
ncbi:MAG TPA: hypothetical protein VMH86_03765 [Rhizomicrobium sp.]|nr:hypothetical protein [Rhizomicrobium sp.]